MNSKILRMKNNPFGIGSTRLLFAIIVFATAAAQCMAQTAALTPASVLDEMQHVADWQLAHPVTERPTGWICAVGDIGMMALAGISGDAKYHEAMLAKGEANDWKLPQYQGRKYHADDQCIGQVWTELYFRYRENGMIGPMRAKMDYILANPPAAQSLEFGPSRQETWSWCDALFMAPPAWVRLYAATDDERYLDFGVTNFWRTTDELYDKDEHLFFRDSTFFNKREANGEKMFWSRGNGWVLAGIARVLEYLPMNHPDRPRFEQLFKDMAAKVLSCQQSDGMWRASLLDPQDFPMPEASGTALFTYGLAWGVNQGLLDRATYEPAVQKAWVGLMNCVDADGKLTHIQPAGSAPAQFDADSTQPYGSGVFLLAGSEVYRMAVLEKAKPVTVTVTNPSDFRRDCETIDLFAGRMAETAIASGIDAIGQPIVMDGTSSRVLDSQVYSEPDETNNPARRLLFQVDLAPHETRKYYILDAPALAAVPPPIVKTFARYVPERHDDIAWESDRIAHRMYGPALETWKAEPLTSSGIDVWVKRTRNLIINHMYGTGVYFDTNGPSQDDFKVGKTRGCGGLGIWSDGKLHVSKNWRTYKVITTGPVRSEFELTYDAWDGGNGRMVSETKRISIDANSNMSHMESSFSSDDKSPLQIGVGIGERPGENIFTNDTADASELIDHWQDSTAQGLVVQDLAEGYMWYWQPQDFAKGVIGTAILLPKGSIETFTNDNPNLPAAKFAAPTHTMTEGQPGLRSLLAIAPAEIGTPFSYYIGASWNESGDFPDAKAWGDYVRRFAQGRDEPLQVAIGN